MIEFTPVYQPGTAVVRCAGDEGCGAHVNTGDMEVHQRWHERLTRMFEAAGVTISVSRVPTMPWGERT